MEEKIISGFSKLSKDEKIQWIAKHFTKDPEEANRSLKGFWHPDEALQRIMDGFSENTLSNYPMPFGVAPNFLINGTPVVVPMVTEESSVVAAASSGAKFWKDRGGIRAEVRSTDKIGQVHFLWTGDKERLYLVLEELKKQLRENALPLTRNMDQRGGGIRDIQLLDFSEQEAGYFQLRVSFETCDSMGANFINSVLESFAETLRSFLAQRLDFPPEERQVEVIMSILSNYTPDCEVRVWVECPIEDLAGACNGMDTRTFADRFQKAVRIAEIDPYRATTHNKGIFNGVDAVVIATGNDFRAVEACGHAHAAAQGHYQSLSHCSLEGGIFRFWMDLPIALGTVGGLTNLHPLARLALEILGNPSAEELMMVAAATGLVQNFAALRSLVTTGIQQGHMKMHLLNVLNHLGASQEEITMAQLHFSDQKVSFNAVRDYLHQIRPQALAKKSQ